MKRTGFARKTYTPPPAAPLRRVERSGVICVISPDVVAMPKTEPKRNRHLLDMARDRGCLLRIPGVCTGWNDSTVAAHSNLLAHGKARGRKADDCYSVWACARCHTWLDSSYSAGFQDKVDAFMCGHLRQVEAWRAIAGDVAEPDKDRVAAGWALEQLNATPVGASGHE